MAANANLRRLANAISRQPEWILALTASLAVVWLHLYFLWHAGGFWRDEVNLLNLSGRHSLTEMSKDSFPVLMPMLVSGWTAIGLGQSDLSLRLLGTLIGLGLPAGLWLASWNIHRRPPLIGLVLLALNSTAIMFGDSLRAFGLGSGLILLTTATACWFLQNPTWRRAGGLAALAVLSVQALYQNSVFIAAICFGAWAVCARQKNWRAALKVFAVAAVSAATLLPYWARVASLPEASAALRMGFSPALALDNLDIAAGFPLEQFFWVWAFLALVVIAGATAALNSGARPIRSTPAGDAPLFGRTTLAMSLATAFGFIWFAVSPKTRWYVLPLLMLAVAALDSGRWRKFFMMRMPTAGEPPRSTGNAKNIDAENAALFAGVTLLAAAAGFAGFLWFAALHTEPWYFIPLMALAAVCYEAGLPSGRHARAAVLGLSVLTLIAAALFARADLDWRFTNVDLIAQRLTRDAASDDFIVVSPWYSGITFDRYFRGATPWNTLPPLEDHSTHRFDLVRKQVQTKDAIQPVFDRIAATLQAGHRVWIVGSMDMPKAGAPVPASLPPKPPDFLGTDVAYSQRWADQAAQFLSNHGRQFTQVYSTTNQNVAPENLKLRVAEGWRNDAFPENPARAETNSP